MKKCLLTFAAVAAALITTVGAFGAKNKSNADPVVMKVNGVDIPLSEFEYLYNKNNSQQLEPTTVDQYVDMFSVYKLKVAEAEASGVDTTRQFLDEFKKYRAELAEPYMSDPTVEDSLVNEIFNHMLTNRDVYYIMMFGGRTPEERAAKRQLADSVRTALVNGADFAELANKYSVDKNDGHMGFMKANRYPYDFEKAVYNTPVGQISDVQELKGFGYFIVLPKEERKDPGQVRARHILKVTRGATEREKEIRKAQMDSLYIVLKNGGDFATIARSESQDPGSSTKGGLLPWFGIGDMVPEFEKVTYELAVDSISEPFQSAFGYHIVQKTGERQAPPIEEVKEAILNNIHNDSRRDMAAERQLERFKAKYKAQLNAKTLKEIKKMVDKATEADSTLLLSLEKNNKVIASVGNVQIPVSKAAKEMEFKNGASKGEFYENLTNAAEKLLNEATREYTLDHLGDDHPDYKNLINEYRDGMLLFEVSNANVWDKATKDTEGLENYFNQHRQKYSTWDKPRYKGEVIFATNDSILNLAKEFLADKTFDHTDLVKVMKAKFGKKVKVERVLAPQGSNAIIDYLVFDGPEATPSKQWPFFFAYGGKIIEQPEEAIDVKGAVTADYQQELEEAWVKTLKEKYPVVVYPEVLKAVNSQIK